MPRTFLHDAEPRGADAHAASWPHIAAVLPAHLKSATKAHVKVSSAWRGRRAAQTLERFMHEPWPAPVPAARPVRLIGGSGVLDGSMREGDGREIFLQSNFL